MSLATMIWSRPAQLVVDGVLAVVLGGAAAHFLRLRVLWPLGMVGLPKHVLIIACAVVVVAFAYRWGIPRVREKLQQSVGTAPWVVVACALFAASALVVSVPAKFLIPKEDHSLRIEALGRRNDLARSSEVWLQSAGFSEGPTLSADDFRVSGGWLKNPDGSLVVPDHFPATLEWQGRARGELQLRFVSQPWAGIVTISFDGIVHTVDLFSDPADFAGRTLALSPVSMTPAPFGWQLLSLLSEILTVAAALLYVIAPLAIRAPPHPPQTGLIGWRRSAFYALPPLFVWSVWLAAFWPGLMTSDSTDQWLQARGVAPFRDHHPIAHTLFIRLIISVWESPAAVASVQIILLAVILAWGVTEARKHGGPAWAAWFSVGLCCVLPVICTMVITLWKDVPFSMAVVALAIAVLALLRTQGRLLKTGGGMAAVATLCALVIVFRHNWHGAMTGAFLALFIGLKPLRRRLAVLAIVALVLGLGSRQLMLKATNADLMVSSFPLVGILAAHVASGTELTPEEAAILDATHPLRDRWNYNCQSNVPTVWGGKFNGEALARHNNRLFSVAASLTARNPRAALDFLICSSALVWRMHADDGQFTNGPAMGFGAQGEPVTIYKVDGGPSAASRWLRMRDALGRLVLLSLERPLLVALFWRPALPLLLLILAALLAAIRWQSITPVLALFPALLHSAELVLLLPSPDVRYQYSVILMAIIFAPAWFAARPKLAALAPSGAAAPAITASAT